MKFSHHRSGGADRSLRSEGQVNICYSPTLGHDNLKNWLNKSLYHQHTQKTPEKPYLQTLFVKRLSSKDIQLQELLPELFPQDTPSFTMPQAIPPPALSPLHFLPLQPLPNTSQHSTSPPKPTKIAPHPKTFPGSSVQIHHVQVFKGSGAHSVSTSSFKGPFSKDVTHWQGYAD